MDLLTLYGLISLAATLITYKLEQYNDWFILAFAGSCVSAAIYGFVQPGAWPFGLIEAIWAVVAFHKWLHAYRKTNCNG